MRKKNFLNTPIYRRIGLTKKEYEDNNILRVHERNFVKRFTERGEDIKWIKRDSLVDTKTGGYYPTNDFIWNNQEWELKSILKKNFSEGTVIKRINESVDKGKRNIFLDLGNNILQEKLLKRLCEYNSSRIKNKAKKRYINNIIVYDKKGLHKIVLK